MFLGAQEFGFPTAMVEKDIVEYELEVRIRVLYRIVISAIKKWRKILFYVFKRMLWKGK